MNYPRVLILGETFRLNGGGGITLTNLFKGWPSDRLAVVTERIGETWEDANCVNFYQLGHLERKVPFPLNKFMKSNISGNVDIRKNKKSFVVQGRSIKSLLKPIIRDILNTIFTYSGSFHFIYKTTSSAELLKWIRDFKPDIIYAQPFRFSDMVFIRDLQRLTSVPMAIHIMDDSISFLNKPNMLYFYWRRQTKSIFRQLVDNSVIHLSISKYMSDEYLKRYGKVFIPFRNPIDMEDWLPYVKDNWEINNPVKIIYTGRLAVPNINALYRFCEVVNNLNKSSLSIKFEIFSIDDNRRFRSRVKNLMGISIHDSIPYTDIPRLLPEYDIVLLPIDFDKKGIRFAKYSISTKTSEYMISGVPIILLAPAEVALTSYALENNCMLSVSDDGVDEISRELVRLMNDKNLRESLVKRAIEVVKNDSDARTVRMEFKNVLSSASI